MRLRLRSDESPEKVPRPGFRGRLARNWNVLLILSVVVVLAFILRSFFAYDVAVAGGYGLSGGSSAAYHARIIEHIVTNWSHVINDTAVNYPYTELNPNPPLMSWTLAVIAKIVTLFGVPTSAAATGTLVWSTAIMGSLTCIPVYYLARNMFGHVAGVMAAFFYAVCAATISWTVLSNGTEAAFYGFFFVVMLYFLHRAVGAARTEASDRSGSVRERARAIYGANREALRYAALAGLALAAVELSWNGFRPIVVMIGLIMVIQAVLDRIRGKDASSVTLVYAAVLAVSTLMSAPVYAAVGLWSAVYSGPFLIAVLSVAAAIVSGTKGRPWVLAVPLAAAVTAAVLAVLWLALPGLYSDVVHGNSIYADPTFSSLVDMSGTVSLSAMAGYYGWLTMWFPYVVIALAAYRFREQTESHSRMFVLMWLIAMMAISWSGGQGMFLAAPGYVIGAAAFAAWVLRKADIPAYVAGFKGVGFHPVAFVRNMVRPVPFVSILAAVSLVAAPNAMYAIDAATSLNDGGSGYVGGYTGAFGYYVRNDADWKMNDLWDHYASLEKDGALVSWSDYSAEAVAKGGFDTVAGPNGSGAAAASNILLSAAGPASVIAMSVRLMEYSGIDSLEAFLRTLITDEDYTELKRIMDRRNTDEWRERILGNPYVYGKYSKSISDENVMYVSAAYFLLNVANGGKGITETQSLDLYDEACRVSGKSMDYIMVSREMFPIMYRDGSAFSTLAYMNGYHLNESGSPIQYYNTSYYGTLNYTQAMYDSMLWRTYIGPSPSDLGYTSSTAMFNAFALSDGSDNTRPQPGFGMSNFEVSYWKVLYNPDPDASVDSDGWVEMDAFEAMKKQDDLRADGKTGGLINFMSGLPVVLRYVHTDELQKVSGTVECGSVNVKGARVSYVDERGQKGTVFTDADGKFELYVQDTSGELKVSMGSDSMKGGLEVYSGIVTNTPVPVTLDEVEYKCTVHHSEEDLELVKESLELEMEGTVHGKKVSVSRNDGTFTIGGLVPDTYKVTARNASGETVASATFQPAKGLGGEIQVRLYLSTSVDLNITDEFGSPASGFVKLTLIGSETYQRVAELDAGKGSIRVMPGTYKAALASDIDGTEHASLDLFDSYVTVSSGAQTLTARAMRYSTISVNIDSSVDFDTMEIHATNAGYETVSAVVKGVTALPVSIRVPVGIEGGQKYCVYGVYKTGGERWIATIAPGADGIMTGLPGSITLIQTSAMSEYSGTIKASNGNPVSATADFYPVGNSVPFISVWAENGKMNVWLPDGDYVMHVHSTDTRTREAYMEKISVSGPSERDITLKEARTMRVEVLSSDSGTGRIPMVKLHIKEEGGDVSMDTVTGADGILSILIPRGDSSYELSISDNIGGYAMADDEGGRVKKTVSSSYGSTSVFKTSTPTLHSAAGGEVIFEYMLGGSPQDAAGVKVKMTLTSDSKDYEFTTDASGKAPADTLPVGEYTISVDKDAEGYHYTGARVNLYISGGVVKIILTKLTEREFTGLSGEDRIEVLALDEEEGKHYYDGRSAGSQKYYFEFGKQFQVKITDQAGEKVFYHFHEQTDETDPDENKNRVTVSLEELRKVKGYAGYPASGRLTVTVLAQTIYAVVDTSGVYSVDLPSSMTGDAEFRSLLGKATAVPGETEWMDSRTVDIGSIPASGTVNLAAEGAPNPADPDPGMPVAEVVGGFTVSGREAEFTVEVSASPVSLFISGGSGWESVRFFKDAGYNTEIDHTDPGVYTFYVKGMIKADTAYDSSSLSLSFADAAGSVKATLPVTGIVPEASDKVENVTIGRGESDVYGGNEYRFSVLLRNDGNTAQDLILTASAPSGWFLLFTDPAGETVNAAPMTFSVPGRTDMNVFVKLINNGSESLPESMSVLVQTGLAADKVHAGTGAELVGSDVRVTINPSAAALTLDGGSASGPNVFDLAGSVPAGVWALMAGSVLLFVLILWMGMKRGVFLRR